MPRSDRSRTRGVAIFGAFDGLNTALGVVLGSQHAPRHLILTIALCTAFTSALSMGAGELLEDNDVGVWTAVVMAIATLVGTFVPAVPVLLFAHATAFTVIATLSLGFAALVGWARGATRRAYLTSFGLLALVAVPTIFLARFLSG